MKTEIKEFNNEKYIDVIKEPVVKVRYSKTDLEGRIEKLNASIEKFINERDRLISLLGEIQDYEDRK